MKIDMNNQSIHPRVTFSKEKVNTCGSPNKELIKAKLVRMAAHVDRHPNDGATKQHMSKKEAML